MSVNPIYIPNELSCQVDPLLELGLDRSSLDRLRNIIAEIRTSEGDDVAYEVTRWLADPITLSRFMNTIFLHATNGYVQFRMFIDGQDRKPWGWPWKAAPVVDRGLMLYSAITLASQAALSGDKVNFCPPVCTFIGPTKARIEDTCEGVAIMVECDHHPVLSQQVLVYVLGTPTIVVKSGGVWIDPETGKQQDKVHLYWRLAQPTRESADHGKLREARELASLIVSSDPTAKPPVHPLRWPGSWHKKAEPRLARIAEINHEVEIELDDALAKLRDSACELRIATTRQEEIAKSAASPLINLSRDVEWKYDHIMDGYRSLSGGRHHALSALAVSLAMSALNAGYNIEAGELQDLLVQAQRDNPPSSRYNEKELAHLAETSIPMAQARVGDDAAYKKKAEAEARWQAEEARIRREIEEMDAEGAAKESAMHEPAFDDGPDDSALAEDETAADNLPPPPPKQTNPPTPKLSPRTPSLSAREFIRRQATPMRFWRGDFYRWIGTVYERLDDAEVKSQVYRFLDNSVTHEGKRFATNKKGVAEITDALEAHLLERSQTDPDSDPDLISFQNGALRVSTKELLTHDPKRFSLHSLPFDYDPTLPPPTEWLQFLRSLYQDRTDYIDLIQEIIGYYVSGRTDLQKIFLVTGPARAGKGTITWVIRKLLGEKYIANLTLDKFGKDFGMQGLIGKTALIIPDARQGRVNLTVVTERLLNISGEDPIAIARKFKDDWDGMLKTRVMILSNEVPRLPDATGTIATRFIPVRLFISFLGREDNFLKDRLCPELPQIMNWALQGLDRLNERGFFLIPEDARETIEKLRRAATPVFDFKEDHLIIDPQAVTYKQRVYERFCGYLLSKGHERVSETKFSIDLQALIPGLTECRPRVNGRAGPRMWKGIRLIDENDPSLHSQWDDGIASNDRELCDREFEANGILPRSMKDLRDSEVMRIRDKIRDQIPVLVKEQFDARTAVHEQMASIFPSGNGYAND